MGTSAVYALAREEESAGGDRSPSVRAMRTDQPPGSVAPCASCVRACGTGRREHNDLELWIPAHRAVVFGDALVDFGAGFGFNHWLKAA